MIDGLKPYAAYKDSGVLWLGQVPEHWELERLKRRASNVVDYSAERLDGEACVGLEHVESWTGKLRKIEPDMAIDSHVKRFRAGDILFGKLRPYLAKVARPAQDGSCVGEFLVIRPRGRDVGSDFLECLLRSQPIIAAIDSSTFGAKMPRTDWQFLGDLRLSFPPLSEQTAIVRFLAHADRRIQRYIRAKKKLIALLNEQKQVIIHRAVTRGLDPDVRLKASGVEWLGEVPEHWGVSQIRSLAYVVRGSSPRPAGSALYFHGTGMPWITVGEITKDSGMHLTSTATRLTPAGEECSRTIEAGTLLLTNSGATLGVPKISLIQGCINDGVAALLRPRVSREFLYFFLTTQTAHLKAWVSLGAQPNLNTQIIGGWPALVPPAAEQNQVVEYVTQETATIMRALEKAYDEVALLQEYRTRLIADVVTGKLDVREVAARLPEEAEEPESLDEIEVTVEDEAEGLDEVSEEAVA